MSRQSCLDVIPAFQADDVTTVEPTKVHLVSHTYIIQGFYLFMCGVRIADLFSFMRCVHFILSFFCCCLNSAACAKWFLCL
jgi:hypothetical protein